MKRLPGGHETRRQSRVSISDSFFFSRISVTSLGGFGYSGFGFLSPLSSSASDLVLSLPVDEGRELR